MALHIWWPKYRSFSISLSNEYLGLISFRTEWFDLLAVQGLTWPSVGDSKNGHTIFSLTMRSGSPRPLTLRQSTWLALVSSKYIASRKLKSAGELRPALFCSTWNPELLIRMRLQGDEWPDEVSYPSQPGHWLQTHAWPPKEISQLCLHRELLKLAQIAKLQNL